MKVGTVEAARVVRDASNEAMDALNSVEVEVAPLLSEAGSQELRLAVARGMTAILDNLVNPVLKEYPELDVDEDTWGDIAASRARARLTAANDSSNEGCIVPGDGTVIIVGSAASGDDRSAPEGAGGMSGHGGNGTGGP